MSEDKVFPEDGTDRNIYISDKTDIESPDSSIITSSANQIFYQDIRADSSFQTFSRQKKVSVGLSSCER